MPSPSPSPSLTLPPPQTFDIIPPLHGLLSRLLVAATEYTTTSTPLSAKDLGSEASAIKIKIQKARAAVEALPDVDRTVQEQELEIRELEDRIEGLKKVLNSVAARGRQLIPLDAKDS